MGAKRTRLLYKRGISHESYREELIKFLKIKFAEPVGVRPIDRKRGNKTANMTINKIDCRTVEQNIL